MVMFPSVSVASSHSLVTLRMEVDHEHPRVQSRGKLILFALDPGEAADGGANLLILRPRALHTAVAGCAAGKARKLVN
jgi:hypothetical protein